MSTTETNTTQNLIQSGDGNGAIVLFIENVGCNKQVANTLYTNAKAGVNQLQVMLYARGHDATITACTDFDAATQTPTPATGSYLSLNLSALQLTTDQFAQMTVKLNTTLTATSFNNPSDWIIKKDPHKPILYFAPKCGGTLTKQSASQTTAPPQHTALVFNLTNFATSQLPGAQTILPSGTAFNISPMASEYGEASPNCPLKLAAAPNATDLSLPSILGFSLESNGFLVPTTKPGRFSFTLESQGQGAKAGSNTAFYLSFPINDPKSPQTKKSALTTKKNAEHIKVSQPDGWHVKPNTVADPYWTLTPPKDQIIAKTPVTFTVSNIETDFPAGATFMTLSWNDPNTHKSTVPHYAAGSFIGILYKLPRVEISQFAFHPNKILIQNTDGTYKYSGQLKWQFEHVTKATASGGNQPFDGKHTLPIPSDHEDGQTRVSDWLSQQDLRSNSKFKYTLKVSNTNFPDNNNYQNPATCYAPVVPPIAHFKADELLYYKDLNRELRVSWQIDYAQIPYIEIIDTSTTEPTVLHKQKKAASGSYLLDLKGKLPTKIELRAYLNSDMKAYLPTTYSSKQLTFSTFDDSIESMTFFPKGLIYFIDPLFSIVKTVKGSQALFSYLNPIDGKNDNILNASEYGIIPFVSSSLNKDYLAITHSNAVANLSRVEIFDRDPINLKYKHLQTFFAQYENPEPNVNFLSDDNYLLEYGCDFDHTPKKKVFVLRKRTNGRFEQVGRPVVCQFKQYFLLYRGAVDIPELQQAFIYAVRGAIGETNYAYIFQLKYNYNGMQLVDKIMWPSPTSQLLNVGMALSKDNKWILAARGIREKIEIGVFGSDGGQGWRFFQSYSFLLKTPNPWGLLFARIPNSNYFMVSGSCDPKGIFMSLIRLDNTGVIHKVDLEFAANTIAQFANQGYTFEWTWDGMGKNFVSWSYMHLCLPKNYTQSVTLNFKLNTH